jgi:hypothetical protein
MHLNHSLLPDCDSRVSSLRTGDFSVVKARGHWEGDLWHSLSFCNGMANPSGCIFHPVTAGVGLSPSSDLRAHFGSGTESRVNFIDIRWPSGIVQTVREVASDLVLKIEGPQK